MNKDVIYIEPEDDITNIISKLESAKEKIVALVPPKKSGVLRSVVNIKLITKASSAKNKKVVFVTTDPSIIKLAATAKIPVTKNLQTPPTIPSLDDAEDEASSEEVLEEEPKEESEEKAKEETEEEAEEEVEEESDEKEETKEESEEKESDEKEETDKKEDKTEDSDKKLADTTKAVKADSKKKEKTKKEKKTSSNPVIAWILNYKKWVIIGAVALVLMILFLIWALVIAPAVKVTVQVRTDLNNFSELVSFTTDPASENAEEGIFYLEEVKVEEEQKTEFTATGTKNVGEKASGSIILQTNFWAHEVGQPININAGSAFVSNKLTFYSTTDATLSWNGEESQCDNKGLVNIMKNGCFRSVKVSVVAAAPGEAYNLDATNFTTTVSRVSAYSNEAFTGGTDKNIIVVSSDNVLTAKAKIANENNTEEKKKEIEKALNEKIGDDKIKITSSYKQVMSDPESSPAVDEEVTDNVIPSVTLKTTTSIYVLDRTKLEEFITKKAKLAGDQKIYAINDPFVESFVSTESGYTGKLKTGYYTGPKITENDILELVKGKGFGDIRHDLGSVNGVSQVLVEGSYPWVNAAPNDSNKITIEMTLKDEDEKNNP